MCFFLNIIDFMQMGLIIVDFGERDRDKRERERGALGFFNGWVGS